MTQATDKLIIDIAFSQKDYKTVIDSLDAIMSLMKEQFGKTEEEAQTWMESFIKMHYFPVWRAINSPD